MSEIVRYLLVGKSGGHKSGGGEVSQIVEASVRQVCSLLVSVEVHRDIVSYHRSFTAVGREYIPVPIMAA